MQIGPGLRQLRGDMTLEQLQERSGVSAPFISKLERDKAFATRETFLAILDVIGPDDDLLFARDVAELQRSGWADADAMTVIAKLAQLDAETRAVLIDRWGREADEARGQRSARARRRVALSPSR